MKKTLSCFFWISLIFLIGGCAIFRRSGPSLDIEKLSPEDIGKVQALIAKLEPYIKIKDEKGELSGLTFRELESPLNSEQKRFLKAFRELPAARVGVRIPFRGFSQGCNSLVRLEGQKIQIKGVEKEIPPQFLSPHVYAAYQFMMQAMQRDIGKRLRVESAYRSSAYQLYLFVYYLSNHDYSVRETVKWVALPGYSEHGDPEHLALDFISADGINGEENASEFEVLPEYQWLLANASRFGFVLSYPKTGGAGITYEPWHWRWAGALTSPQSCDGKAHPVRGSHL